MTYMELSPRFERVLAEIPGLTIEQRTRARTLFLECEPCFREDALSQSDEYLAGYLKACLKLDWDFLYMLQQLWKRLFPEPQDGYFHRQGPVSNNEDSMLPEDPGKTNLRRRNVQSTVRT
ncbi:hypothetical protein Vafri_1087 [Volvox africanus]|nr:hypothetical protein Vafri_1087 [Volvox africanus]